MLAAGGRRVANKNAGEQEKMICQPLGEVLGKVVQEL